MLGYGNSAGNKPVLEDINEVRAHIARCGDIHQY